MLFDTEISRVDPPALEAATRLRVFIIYEDLVDGKNAKEVCDFLAKRLGHEWELAVDLSSFQQLRLPRLRQATAKVAADANVILLSSHQPVLAPEIRRRIACVLSASSWLAALVTLVDGARVPTSQPTEMEQFAAHLAQRRGLPFFSNRGAPDMKASFLLAPLCAT